MEPIRFYLTTRQSAIMQKLFDSTPNPGFTILGSKLVSEEEDVYAVDIFFESSWKLWYTIQMAYIDEKHQEQLDEITAEMRSAIDKFLSKVSK